MSRRFSVSPSVTAPVGFFASGATCGIKASGSPDLTLIVSDRPCAAAGVFTTSRTPAEPIVVNRRHLRGGRARAIVVNSGNANASTGKAGERDARRMCAVVARELASVVPARFGDLGAGNLRAADVLVASTGIIGRPLPMEKIERGIVTLASRVGRGRGADAAAARGIMTTDLVPKAAYREVKIGRATVRIGGITKGSGMIAPNMATMLAFITTDAAAPAGLLQRVLRQAVAASFNRISVDQHTSPSDMVLALANGAAGHSPLRAGSRDAAMFAAALTDLCRDLAEQIVRDGEGATKVFRVRVVGASSEREGDRVGRAVVDSPLVKCAVHGGDPNWGRITTAAGYSGAAVVPAKMSLFIGATGREPLCVYRSGAPVALNGSQQRTLAAAMRKADITFVLDLGRGKRSVEWLGCDLSRQYIAINADYTT